MTTDEPREFQCALCGFRFRAAWTEAEAIAEARRVFDFVVMNDRLRLVADITAPLERAKQGFAPEHITEALQAIRARVERAIGLIRGGRIEDALSCLNRLCATLPQPETRHKRAAEDF